MSIMSIYSNEINNKSAFYDDVNFLISRYNIIRILNKSDTNFEIGKCKYQFSSVSDEVKKLRMGSIINSVDSVCSSFNDDKKESQSILNVLTAILAQRTARTIQQELHISMSTYCRCRFILVNKVASILEKEMWQQ